MRVTNRMIYDQASSNIIDVSEGLYEANDKLVTGKKVLRPSDDPSGVNKILSYRTLESNINQYGRNINAARTRLESVESALASGSNTFQRLKELAIAQANATMTASDRQIAAIEAQELLEELVGIGNTKADGGYIFAGYANNSLPFQSDGSVTAGINISGEISIQIDSGTAIKANIPGDRLFKGALGGIDVFGAIKDFVTALNSNDTAGIMAAIDNMDTSLRQIVNSRAEVGVRLGRVDMTKERLDEIKLVTIKALSSEEDVDIAIAISDFTAKQHALEAASSAASRMFQMPRLMDFLK